jgi:Yip1 domain.
MNTPMAPIPNAPRSVVQVWRDALTKPNEQTYAELANSPDASPGKAYLWIFLASLVSVFVSVLVRVLVAGSSGQADQLQSVFGGSMIALICVVPVAAGLAVLGFMITTGLVQWVAGLFKGAGTYSQLAYVLGAISAPATLISSILSVFYAIPFLAFCLWPVSILLGLYVIVLSVMAVKGVNKFDWGKAIASYLLPTVVFCGLCLLPIIVIGAMRLLGPKIGDTFSTIQSSLP